MTLTGCPSCGAREPEACPCSRKERAAAYQLMMEGREVTAFDRAAMDYIISRTKAPEKDGFAWHLAFFCFLVGIAAWAAAMHFLLESSLCLK